MKKILIGFIKLYQKVISPLTPPSCRFYPTCSHYGIEAVEKHGALKVLGLRYVEFQNAIRFTKVDLILYQTMICIKSNFLKKRFDIIVKPFFPINIKPLI